MVLTSPSQSEGLSVNPLTRNLTDADAERLVDELLAEPFGNWHVETTDEIRQLRVTKSGAAQVHRARTSRRDVQPRSSTMATTVGGVACPRDPLFDALGADADKRRQVDAFLRLLAPTVERALARSSAADRSLHVVDLGCGNAYLTVAAHQYLLGRAAQIGAAGVRTVGVDVRADTVARNRDLAARLGMAGLDFVEGAIESLVANPRPGAAQPGPGGLPPGSDGSDPGLDEIDIVLALHACDTATDDALAAAVRWRAPVVLAAPCCHHDVQRQLTARQSQACATPYRALLRYPILRERFADVLTDAVRAGLLRLAGYRVDVVEFVDSRHTPRNALIRAEFTGAGADDLRRAEYDDLVAVWDCGPGWGCSQLGVSRGPAWRASRRSRTP
jgi:SAM-dependent methyltransferase